MSQPAPHGSRAEKTRGAILEAAEALFAERGFDATRLEDIAEQVGIRRASIVYYYKDKRDLYTAVLQSVFGGLYETLAEVLGRPDPLPDRIEAGVSAWVDFVGERPTTARFILREVADVTSRDRPSVSLHTAPFAELIKKQVFERPDFRDVKLNKVDPAQLASVISGSTVFFVAAMPLLVPSSYDPTSQEHLAAHKHQLIRIVRSILGTHPVN